MKYSGTLLSVASAAKSKKFYEEVMKQEVLLDIEGVNITFKSGFTIQEGYESLVGVPSFKTGTKANDHELYFETENFDDFITHLQKFTEIKYIHLPKEYPWLQRVTRFYDPDFHIIEAAESMASVFKELQQKGNAPEQIAKLTMHPIEYVLAVLPKRDAMKMAQRISLITLGVKDLVKSTKFYEDLGWVKNNMSSPNITFFELKKQMLALFPMDELLKGQNSPEVTANGAITLAYNVNSSIEVDELLAKFKNLGGKIISKPLQYPWGYVSYASDLDGHIWEISYIPDILPEKLELL